MAYKHLPIVAALKERIADGTYAPGERLPSQAEIRATYGVGDRVARAALRTVVEEGLAISRPRHGIFVATYEPAADTNGDDQAPPAPARPRRTHAARRLRPADAPTAGDEDLTATPTTTTAPPPPDIAVMLDIEPDTPVTTHRRILSDDYGPVALRTTYERAPTGHRATITTHTSARRAYPDEARALATTRAAVVLVHDETAHHTQGEPTTHTRTVYRAEVRLTDQYRSEA